jgi:tocopherol O-methyltransferase
MNVSKTPSAVAGDNAAEVSRYYNNSQWIYDLLWMNKKNLAMHYGFWDKKTASRADALLNVNEYVARDLDIRAADVVLDAGCGVGGTAIWMAEERGARVTGLTITQKQVALARKHISRRGVRALVNVELADFCRTGLPSQSFDKIYAIESVCHAPEKASFLTEAFRLLKPGGGSPSMTTSSRAPVAPLTSKTTRRTAEGGSCLACRR